MEEFKLIEQFEQTGIKSVVNLQVKYYLTTLKLRPQILKFFLPEGLDLSYFKQTITSAGSNNQRNLKYKWFSPSGFKY